MKRRQLIQAASGAMAAPALTSLSALSFAQAKYPSKPITWIVGYAAGGNADLRSRAMARALGQVLGGTVVVENKPGAGANIGTNAIIKAAPDGYTIGMGSFAPLSVNSSLFKSMPFNPADATPIMLIEKGPLILMVNADSPYKSVKELIAAVKAKPGHLAYSTGGIGGSHHLSAALFCNAAGLDMIPVHFKSGSEGATALLGNQVAIMFVQMYEAMPMMEAGKLRGLAITSAKRSPLQPSLPSMTETGYADVEVLNWQGVIGPKGMSADLVQQLNAAANKALLMPDVKDKLLAQGNVLGGGTPEQFAALIKSETAKWAKVVKDAKIELQ
ncbi:MAG: tripartite tricarboxylate transporter substrate binding protein [Cytophagales bacterium]|nr:tripartite tricarboxylate transporter substrate binding protein [Cytophagales bacterium]